MNESKRRNEKAGFIIKLIIGICTLGIIYLLQYASFSQFSYDSSLFQSAFYSLLMLLFWIGAGWILRKPSHSIKTE